MKLKTQRKNAKRQLQERKSGQYKKLLAGSLKIMGFIINAVGFPQHVETRKDKELQKQIIDAIPTGDFSEEKVQTK